MKLAAVLLVVALASPVFAQAPKIEVSYSQFTLPNGLRVNLGPIKVLTIDDIFGPAPAISE